MRPPGAVKEPRTLVESLCVPRVNSQRIVEQPRRNAQSISLWAGWGNDPFLLQVELPKRHKRRERTRVSSDGLNY